jgi:hypothetical protein
MTAQTVAVVLLIAAAAAWLAKSVAAKRGRKGHICGGCGKCGAAKRRVDDHGCPKKHSAKKE